MKFPWLKFQGFFKALIVSFCLCANICRSLSMAYHSNILPTNPYCRTNSILSSILVWFSLILWKTWVCFQRLNNELLISSTYVYGLQAVILVFQVMRVSILLEKWAVCPMVILSLLDSSILKSSLLGVIASRWCKSV